MENNGFDWVGFYKKFAETLLGYQNKREELFTKVQQGFQNIGKPLPKLCGNDNNKDIDPFTVFALFNRGLTDSSRKLIISEFKNQFHISSVVPSHFDGIPIMQSINAVLYNLESKQKKQEIDNLWNLFIYALKYEEDQNAETLGLLKKYFSLSMQIKGNATGKITMGLFWIAPDFYISLDSRNTWFFKQPGSFPEDFSKSLPEIPHRISADSYFTIQKKMLDFLKSGESKYKSLPELSFRAWENSCEENKRIKEEEAAKEPTNVDSDVESVHYWLFSAGWNGEKWDTFHDKGIMALMFGETGDLSSFGSQGEVTKKLKDAFDENQSYRNNSHALWEFAKVMKPGDIIIVKKGKNQIIAKGTVTSDYQYDAIMEDGYSHVREVDWTDVGNYENPDGQSAIKTLTDITRYPEYVQKLLALFGQEEEVPEKEDSIPLYSKDNFLKEAFIGEEQYNTLSMLLSQDKNLILEGAPGVGKTYLAKRLAYSIIGKKDADKVEMVQFHQGYSYEDFIMGYRPSSNPNQPWEIQTGIFYRFCKKAEEDPDNKYFFIIDEINRGNLSKIFGELFVLLEPDKRGNSIRLLYNSELFNIPKNLYIIGTMNTADRSLALIDYALRRRFSFYDLRPAFENPNFLEEQKKHNDQKLDKVIQTIQSLNETIASDESLGEGFQIGHSYFSNLPENYSLNNIIEYKIIPLLKEYWFDSSDKVHEWATRLRDAIR